jgi:hypothetical protein
MAQVLAVFSGMLRDAGDEHDRHDVRQEGRRQILIERRAGLGRANERDRSHGTPQSCRTTVSSELLILSGISPLYSMKPSLLNLFRK